MGLTHSTVQINFFWYRLTARNLTIPSNEITSVRERNFVCLIMDIEAHGSIIMMKPLSE